MMDSQGQGNQEPDKDLVSSFSDSTLIHHTAKGDHYNIGHAGAVGRGAKAVDSGKASIEDALADIDMAALARELAILFRALAESTPNPEDDLAVAEIAQAARAAGEQDKVSTFIHLRNSGKRPLETANAIGLDIVATLLRRVLELP